MPAITSKNRDIHIKKRQLSRNDGQVHRLSWEKNGVKAGCIDKTFLARSGFLRLFNTILLKIPDFQAAQLFGNVRLFLGIFFDSNYLSSGMNHFLAKHIGQFTPIGGFRIDDTKPMIA